MPPKQARDYLKNATIDFELLDEEVNRIIWTFTNLFPGCLIKSIEGIRLKKKFFWDQIQGDQPALAGRQHGR